MKSNWVLQKDLKSFCPECDSNVHLLIRKDYHPCVSFYICFNCKYTTEVGVGPVAGVKKKKCQK